MAKTIPQSLTDLEPVIQTLFGVLQARQTIYKTAKNKFFQGLKTHTGKVQNAAETTADNLTAKPTDQAEAWASFFPAVPPKFPYSIQINTYNAPSGSGYEVVLETEIGSETYRRVLNSGSETHRESGWSEVSAA